MSSPAAIRVHSFGTTVFAEFTAMSIAHNAVNLGQGFPDWPAPDFVIDAARTALAAGHNQYARSAGHPRLVNALAAVYSPCFGQALNPLTEIVVTTGATEAIFATIQGLVDPGDEVILIEPFYDSYPASVIMAGGTPVYIPLRAAGGASSAAAWQVDVDELRSLLTPKTKLLIINTPQNPVGKTFSQEELLALAQIAQEHDLLVLSDEVYEWMTYDGKPHVRIATLPGMWERTITLGSAGKTFSVTGWKIGWAIAPEPLAHAVLMAHQWIPFAVTTPLQEAVGVAFEQVQERNYFHELSKMYQAKRDILLAALADVGVPPVIPHGSYFILVDTTGLDVPTPTDDPRDIQVCRWLTRDVGVTAIPPSSFYSPAHKHLATNVARFCFCKTDAVLEAAAERLRENLQS